jgi:hypothetical protein
MALQFCAVVTDKECMVYRLFIDVLRRRVEFGEGISTKVVGLENRATLLDIRLNCFIPRDFIVRCKVVECS